MLPEHPLAWQPPSPKAQGRVWPSGRGLPPRWGAKGHPLPCTQGARLCPGLSPCPLIPSQALLGFGGPQVPACALGPGNAWPYPTLVLWGHPAGATSSWPRGAMSHCLNPCAVWEGGTQGPAPRVVSSHCVPKASRAGTGPWHWGEPSPVGAAGFTPCACTSLRMLQGCCCLCPPLGSSSPRSPHRTKGSATPGPPLLGPLLGRGTPGAAPSTLSCPRPLFVPGFWGHLATLPGGHLPPGPPWPSCRSPLVLSRPARLASPPRCLPAAAPAPLGAHFSVCPTASPPRTGLSPSPRWLGR